MRGEVAVAKIEPIGAAVEGEALQGVKRFAAKSPAFLRIDDSGKRVGNDVEVGGDSQAVEDDVIAGVDDDGQQGRVHRFIKTEEEF